HLRCFFQIGSTHSYIYTLSLHDALPIYSPVATYVPRSRGVSSRKVTRVPSCSTTSQPGVSRQRPDMTTCVLPDSCTRVTFRELRSEEHTSELQSRGQLVCRLLLEKKKPA